MIPIIKNASMASIMTWLSPSSLRLCHLVTSQADYWSSQAADTRGSRNYVGVKSPVIDSLIGHVINAKSREDLVTAVRALDRVLLWQHYVVPHWHINVFRIAWWNRFGRPTILPPYTFSLDFWWFDKNKDLRLHRQSQPRMDGQNSDDTARRGEDRGGEGGGWLWFGLG